MHAERKIDSKKTVYVVCAELLAIYDESLCEGEEMPVYI